MVHLTTPAGPGTIYRNAVILYEVNGLNAGYGRTCVITVTGLIEPRLDEHMARRLRAPFGDGCRVQLAVAAWAGMRMRQRT